MSVLHISLRKHNAGLVTVEFAVVGLTLLVLLFACLEIGRLMFTWNTLAEMTRLGARAASVCPVDSSAVTQIATLTRNGASVLPLSIRNALRISYLDEDGNPVASPGTAAGFVQIYFVQARMDSVAYSFLVPGVPSIILPPFQTVRPRESLGIVPGETASAC